MIWSSLLLSLLLLAVCSGDTQNKYELSAPSSICDEVACKCTPTPNGTIVICDFANQDYKVDANSMPKDLYEFYIEGGSLIVFEAKSFSRLSQLSNIIVRNVTTFLAKRESFINLSTQQLQIIINKVERVEIESKSFYLLKGAITYVISSCWSLTIHSEAMPWIGSLTVMDVNYVQLNENAFSRTEKMINYHQGHTTKIHIHRVSMEELPRNAFPSSAAEIKLMECDIKVLRSNAFSALELYDVDIVNSTFNLIQSEAFSERSLIRNLQLSGVKIDKIRPGAISSAVMDLEIANSTINVVEPEAFNMSTMVSLQIVNNVFGQVRTRGVTLRGWTRANIQNNTLRDLDYEAIYVPETDMNSIEPSYFHLVGNTLGGSTKKKHSLSLNMQQPQTAVVIRENNFVEPCHCEWRTFLRDFVRASLNIVDSLYNESYCYVNADFAECLDHVEGFVRTINFTEQRCHPHNTTICRTNSTAVKYPNIIYVTNENEASQEFYLFIVRAVIFVVGPVLICLLCICVFLCNRNTAGGKSAHAGSMISALFSRLTLTRNLNRVASASSITRVSVHDYAEVGPLKLVSSELNDSCIYLCEDKATQTLPEELTQELLQALRDKLDDPQNYTEARNMIEHLYDLIKVEERCNNNLLNEFGEIENIYDVIKCDSSLCLTSKQRVRRYDRSFRTLAHKGTRAPSPDKLSPLTFSSATSSTCFSNASSLYNTRRHFAPALSEYQDPSDRHSCVYSELLYDQCRPMSTSETRPPDVVLVAEYAEPRDHEIPVYSELEEFACRPLPKSIDANRVNEDGNQSSATHL